MEIIIAGFVLNIDPLGILIGVIIGLIFNMLYLLLTDHEQ